MNAHRPAARRRTARRAPRPSCSFNSVAPRRVVQALTLAAVFAEIGLAAALVHQTRSDTIVYWFGGWTPRSGVALGISFTIDQLGAGAALLAGVVTAAAVVTTRGRCEDADGIVHALLLTLLAAMAGFCLTGDLFNLFVFFELMAVSAFGLAAYQTRSLAALRERAEPGHHQQHRRLPRPYRHCPALQPHRRPQPGPDRPPARGRRSAPTA